MGVSSRAESYLPASSLGGLSHFPFTFSFNSVFS